jgi:hypothetical protein
LVQVAETADECTQLAAWFDAMWQQLPATTAAKERLVQQLRALAEHRAPSQIYFLTLYHLFKDLGGELDEAKIVRAATGIRETAVWKKLYKFQRDGVLGAIDKLERSAAASSPTASASVRRSRRSPSSNTTSCATTASWCSRPSAAGQLDALQDQRQAQLLRLIASTTMS